MSKSTDGQTTKVVMHNSLVRHTLKSFSRLGAMEHKIIAAAVAQIDHRSDTIPAIELEVTELAKVAGLKRKDIYEAAHEAARNLVGEVLEFRDPKDNASVICGWMSAARYQHGEGTIICKFAADLKPVLTALKECRTEMELASIMRIGGSAYAHRLYQLACSWRSNHGWTASIATLREQLGVKKNDYPRLYDFKKRVLDGPIRIINERTDIAMAYEKGNKGRSWQSIKFTVLSQSSRPERLKKAERPPDWEIWWDERCETESGQDTIWAAAQELGLVAGARGGLGLSKRHSLFLYAKEIWAAALQSKLDFSISEHS